MLKCLILGRWKWIATFLFLFIVCVVCCRQYSDYACRKARIDLNQDRLADSQNRLKYAVILWPWNSDARFLAARTARLNGDMTTAESLLNQCLKRDGGATERVQLEFLLMRVQSGEIDDLASTLFSLIEQENGHPDSLAILKTMSKAYMQRLRYRPAYACLSKWIEMLPDDPTPYQYRGWALERLGNTKDALADYQKTMELNPNLVDVRLRVVEMYLEDKQAPEAMPHAEFLYQRFPENPRVQARMGMCLFLMGQGAEARRLMEAAEPHLSNDPALLVSLANLDLQDGRPVEAERRLRKVLADDASDTEAMFVLSSALQIQGRSAESQAVQAECLAKKKVLDRIHELLKDSADTPGATSETYAEIGELFLQIEREKFGLYWSDQALEQNPTNQRAHRALAAHYEKKGDLETAAMHRRKLRSTTP